MNVVLDIRRAQTIETAVSSDLERAVNELQAARVSLRPGWLSYGLAVMRVRVCG